MRRKRFAKPGRPQRSQRRSFVVGQPQAPVWLSQPRQAQTRERAIHRSADLEQRRDVVAPRALGPQPGGGPRHRVLPLEPRQEDLADDVGIELVGEADAAVLADEARGELLRPGEERMGRDLDGLGDDPRRDGSSASGSRPVASPGLAPVPAPGTRDAPPASCASSRARPAYPSVALASGSVARSQQPAQMRIEARVLPRPPRFEVMVAGKAPSVPQAKHLRQASLGLGDEPLDVAGGHRVERVDDLGTEGHAQPEPPSRRSVEPVTWAAVWAAMPWAAAVAK